MANVKEVSIRARLPFNWASELTAEEAQVFAAWLLNPVSGLALEQQDLGYEPNASGGKTSIWEASITGHEAIRYPATNVFAEAWARIGQLEQNLVVDLEA